MDNIEQRIISIIAQISDQSPANISVNSSFEELALTSLNAVTIAYELELEFEIEIPDSQVYSIRSVQELFDGVKKLLNKVDCT